MTQIEALKLVKVVKASYPVYYRNVTDGELEDMANLWRVVLGEYSYEECYAAVITLVRRGSAKVVQSPGEIIDEIESLKDKGTENEMTAQEAWKIVRPAIREANYYSQRDFDDFPQIVKDAVGDPSRLKEWANLSSQEVDTVVRADFCNRYFPSVVKRHREDARLPQAMREAISKKREELTQSLEKKAVKKLEMADTESIADTIDHSDHSVQIGLLTDELMHNAV